MKRSVRGARGDLRPYSDQFQRELEANRPEAANLWPELPFQPGKANESTRSKYREAADGLIKPGVQVLLHVELVEPAHALGRIIAMEVTALIS